MIVKLQTMSLDLDNPYLYYREPSKIWNIQKEKLLSYDFFKNLLYFENRDIYILNEISDEEMELFLEYIENRNNFNIKNYTTTDVMLLIKLADFLMVPHLLNLSTNEFFKRL